MSKDAQDAASAAHEASLPTRRIDEEAAHRRMEKFALDLAHGIPIPRMKPRPGMLPRDELKRKKASLRARFRREKGLPPEDPKPPEPTAIEKALVILREYHAVQVLCREIESTLLQPRQPGGGGTPPPLS